MLTYSQDLISLKKGFTEILGPDPHHANLTKVDYTIAVLIGFIATLVDQLIVKIPGDVNYLGKYEQNGSGMTEWLKSKGVNEDGKLNLFFSWMEKHSKVSYDASTSNAFVDYEGDVSGFYPKNHRLMSLGHDPLFGLIFGMIDIYNGSLTLIDKKGAIHKIPIDKFQDTPLTDKIFAPILWFGHILSDVCTKMGIPVPGWGFTQLLQFGKFGEKDRTFADLARWMYVEGYDLRHFITMGIVPGIIQIITRIYMNLTRKKEDTQIFLYEKSLSEIHHSIRLQKLLFISHSIATSGNAIKIMLHQGNPLAININEILALVKQSIQMSQITMRDKTTERVIRNRKSIDQGWEL